MLDQVENMFEDMEKKTKNLKKKKYEENMDKLMAENEMYFLEMEARLDGDDPASAAKKIAEAFVEAVRSRYEVRGKIKGRTQADLNFFMIYYVFPAILKRGHAQAKLLADTLCETWGSSFKDSRIGYTDYDTLYRSFREKIFGII